MNEQPLPYREYTLCLWRAHPSAPWQVSVENVACGQTCQVDSLDGLLAYFRMELTPGAAIDWRAVAAGPSGMCQPGA